MGFFDRTNEITRLHEAVAERAALVDGLRADLVAMEGRVRGLELASRVLSDTIVRLLEVRNGPSSVPIKDSPSPDPMPGVVEQAIAQRAGRGNINRVAQLRASARLLLRGGETSPDEVADTILAGTGEFDL